MASAKDAAYSNGIAGRAIDIVKDAYAKAREMCPLDPDQLIMQKVALAKKLVPAPTTGVSGDVRGGSRGSVRGLGGYASKSESVWRFIYFRRQNKERTRKYATAVHIAHAHYSEGRVGSGEEM